MASCWHEASGKQDMEKARRGPAREAQALAVYLRTCLGNLQSV